MSKATNQLSRSNKHRGEVIEIYDGGLKAAVRFTSGRIECVTRRGIGPAFEVGQTGMADYTRCLSGYEWTFVASKQ